MAKILPFRRTKKEANQQIESVIDKAYMDQDQGDAPYILRNFSWTNDNGRLYGGLQDPLAVRSSS